MKDLIRSALLLLLILGVNQSLGCTHIGNKTTFNDRRCSTELDTSGCNAGGQGRNCRYCGFDKYPDCPTPPPIAVNESIYLATRPRPTSIVHTTPAPFVQRSPLYGIAYSPFRNSTSCSSITDAMIHTDLDRIAAISDAVRIYTLECDFGIKIVKKTRELGLGLVIGLRVTADDSHFRSDRRALDQLLLERSDLSHIIAISVGDDAIAKHFVSETMIIERIRDIRGLLQSYGYQIPVTTSDTYDKYNSYRIVEAVDIMLPNLRVFSSEISAELSPKLVFDMIKRLKSWSVAASKEFIIGETGWPSGGDLAASPQSSWSYLKHFHCQARSSALKYFYFEAFDAAWKQLGANNVDSHWGLGTFDRHWKPGFSDALKC